METASALFVFLIHFHASFGSVHVFLKAKYCLILDGVRPLAGKVGFGSPRAGAAPS
jgi:hypothetical protein